MSKRCVFGEILDTELALNPAVAKKSQEYSQRVLAYMHDFSYEELGDELPGTPEAFDACEEPPIEGLDEIQKVQIIDGIRTCLYARYLKNCQTGGCRDNKAVSAVILQLPEKAPAAGQ